MEEDEDLESLGEQLYNVIYPKHAEAAGKLTGMLLELPGSTLSQMLQDEAMLSAALEKALRALDAPQDHSRKSSYKEEEEDSVSSDSLGDQLFELVDVYNTGCSRKITGMLLEQQKEAILNLLSDSTLLEEKVKLALKTLKEQNGEETDVSDSSDADDTERLGERLYSLVEKMDPGHANDITGMLLEMTPTTLPQLLTDRDLLEVAVRKAQAALETFKSTL